MSGICSNHYISVVQDTVLKQYSKDTRQRYLKEKYHDN